MTVTARSPARLCRRGDRSDRRGRLFRRRLRLLWLRGAGIPRGAGLSPTPAVPRRHAQGADGGHFHAGRARRLHQPRRRGTAMSAATHDLPTSRRGAPRRQRGHHLGLLGASAGDRGGAAPARRDGIRVLIEATCNQVNQDGGYTGMTPADFRGFVEAIAAEAGFRVESIILGGDHLGPNPWKHLPAAEAMAKAEGDDDGLCRGRLHQDPSRHQHGLRRRARRARRRDDRRACRRLAAVAEDAARTPAARCRSTSSAPKCRCPAARSRRSINSSRPRPRLRSRTVEIHRAGIRARRPREPSPGSIGVVVQPGVEFGNENVIAYEPAEARAAERSARPRCRPRLRGAFDRLPDPRSASRSGGGWLCHPQGRPRPDLRAA